VILAGGVGGDAVVTSIAGRYVAPALKRGLIWMRLRGAEAPLFHGGSWFPVKSWHRGE